MRSPDARTRGKDLSRVSCFCFGGLDSLRARADPLVTLILQSRRLEWERKPYWLNYLENRGRMGMAQWGSSRNEVKRAEGATLPGVEVSPPVGGRAKRDLIAFGPGPIRYGLLHIVQN